MLVHGCSAQPSTLNLDTKLQWEVECHRARAMPKYLQLRKAHYPQPPLLPKLLMPFCQYVSQLTDAQVPLC